MMQRTVTKHVAMERAISKSAVPQHAAEMRG